ncbi:MAG: EamA family transporter [Desulfovibrionaceae bacterium]|jgi:drug/metabolite transporter (DMT)-like permease|nr:EamA family transporter [Desulfovibrionaceae bacterium]
MTPETAPTVSSSGAPTLALVLAMVLWGSSLVAMKIALAGFDPLTLMSLRLLVGAALFLAIFGRFRTVHYHKGDWKPMLLMAALEPCCYFLLETHALELTTASQAGMVTATLPVIVGVGAVLTLGERLSSRAWLGLGLAVAGVVLLSATGEAEENAPNPPLGNFLEFLGMACAAGYTLLLKRLSARYAPLFLTAVQAVVGCVFFLPASLLMGDALQTHFSLLPTLAVIYLGSVVTLGAYGLYNFGVSRIKASSAAAYTNLIPVVTLVMGITLLGESFTTPQFAASGLVILGVWLGRRG